MEVKSRRVKDEARRDAESDRGADRSQRATEGKTSVKEADGQTDRESAVFVDSALGRGAGASQTLEMSSTDTGPLGA